MKRTLFGILLVGALSAGSLMAEDGYCNRETRRDIRHDQAKIAHDRQELRRDLYWGDYRGAERERAELRRENRDLRHDYRHIYRGYDRDYDR